VSLLAEARATLEKQAQWLRRNQGVTITISGHADERGTREYNLALGDRRATAVRDYLVALGLEQNRVKTVSFGKERPVDGRSAEDAWSKNRRSVTTVN
jgi:peptidoglycan-associated lipoprotein